MSDYQVYLAEKNQIDFYLNEGYEIHYVYEDLNGSYVQFVKPVDDKKETVYLSTANARKYFSSKLIAADNTL